MAKDQEQKAVPAVTGYVTDRHGDTHHVGDFLTELKGLVQTLHAAEVGVAELEGETASSFYLAALILERVKALYDSARGE
ncbi:MAG: hypothetical protein JZU70_09605 [Chlorobium sp.]|jgi:hypothetical protein|nr:hypothetical protein [Chlorobium sp.]